MLRKRLLFWGTEMEDCTEAGAQCLTSLEALETIDHHFDEEEAYQWQAESPSEPVKGPHAKYHDRRRVIIRTLRLSNEDELMRRAERLKFCACCPHIRVSSANKPSLVLGRCRDRLCPLCSDARGFQCATKLTSLITRMNAPRFVTLTIVNAAGRLGPQVDRLFYCFKQLRKTAWWKSRVKGGTYSLEVTFNQAERTWHPHLHLVTDGSYLVQAELASLWEKITEGSRVVWVKKVNDAKQTAKYLAKYVNTPPNVHEWGHAPLVEYALAMKGRRLIACFGSLHGSNVDPANEPDAPLESVPICTVADLCELAVSGNEKAREAMLFMPRLGGTWKSVASLYDLFPPNPCPKVTIEELLRFGQLVVEAFAPPPPPSNPPPPEVPELHYDPGPTLFEGLSIRPAPR